MYVLQVGCSGLAEQQEVGRIRAASVRNLLVSDGERGHFR